MSRFLKYLFVLGFSTLIISCENTEAELIFYALTDPGTSTVLNEKDMNIEITFPENVRSASDLIADFQISDGAEAFVGNRLQISNESKNSFETPFSFTIVSEDELLSKTWQIRSVNNDYSRSWGMGGFIQKVYSLDRPYEWYIDQGQTGPYSDWNCAPSCVVMAAIWQNETFPYSVEDARQMYHPAGGGWYTEDIDSCLTDFNIEHSIIALSDYRDETCQILIDDLNQGNIILLAIDVHYLNPNYESIVRTGKYYHTIQLGTGHCIIIMGYMQVDGEIYFEVYDPIGFDYKYSDGSFKGKSRYYDSDDLYTSAFASWNYAFVVNGGDSRKVNSSTIKASEIPNILIK